MNRSDNDWPPCGTLAWVLTGVGVWFAVGALVTFYNMQTPIESSLGTLMLAPQLLLFSLLFCPSNGAFGSNSPAHRLVGQALAFDDRSRIVAG
jgi:hypothetical protein